MSKRIFSLILVLAMVSMVSGCFTATGALIGTGAGLAAGGKTGAIVGGLVGAGAGTLVDNLFYYKKQPVSAGGGAVVQRPRSLFRSHDYNRGEKEAYERGRTDHERRLQQERERRAYERGRRGY